MKTLLHFIVRDLKDTLVLWVLLTLITVVGLVVISRERSDIGVIMLGYAYLFFFLIQLAQVWNGVFGRTISREYILSLPVSRTLSFWIMWGRSLVGMLPLLVLLWVYREDVTDSMRTIGRSVEFLEPYGQAKYLVFLAGAVWMFMTIFSNAQSSQVALLMSKGKRRYWPWVKYFAALGIDIVVLLLWGRSFFWPMPISASLALAVGCLVYSAGKARISYVRWMWGNDARVLRSRKPISVSSQ